MGVCDRMATWKDETKARASAGEGLRECFSRRKTIRFICSGDRAVPATRFLGFSQEFIRPSSEQFRLYESAA